VKRCALALVLLLGCGPEVVPSRVASPERTEGTLVVYAINEPLRYFARRIGGDQVEAVFPAPTGVDPANWSPGGDVVAAYQRADLILLNGPGYAGWVARASLPRATQVDTTAGFSERLIPVEGTVTHQHGPAGEHSQGAVALETWLDPALATLQARAVATALSGARPEHEALFAQGLTALEADLADLDRRLRAAAARIGDLPLIFSHPVYAYLQRAYALNGRSLHWEPDQQPDARQWRALEALRREHPARLLIWESAPLAQMRERLADEGISSIVFARASDAGAEDWLTRMRESAAALSGLPPPVSPE
jgi:zinc transport system substrate-binding protein